jgi:hypothetical protein
MTGGEAGAASRRLRTYEELVELGRQRFRQLPPPSPQVIERVVQLFSAALLADSPTAEGDPHPATRP